MNSLNIYCVTDKILKNLDINVKIKKIMLCTPPIKAVAS